MKIKHYKEVKGARFDNGVAKNIVGRVMIGKDDGASHFCMRVFEIGEGGHTPSHTHEWEHEIFIHQGHGELFNNGDWVSVAPGTAIYIPGNELHQIKNKGKEPLVVVCLIPSGVPEL
jgi:quercetin dioxygenase-like cupin family protein